MCDALLALLDDASFRAVDLLGLEDATRSDLKLLTDALRKWCAPSAGHQELTFALSQHEQEPSETLDDYVDSLISLSNRAYPDLDNRLRMGLVFDQFLRRLRSEHIQDALLNSPKNLSEDGQMAGSVAGCT